MTRLTCALLLLFMISARAQQSPVGEYYLNGVMETASGFKVNADSTFEFFFSQGALDRYGKGTWTVSNKSLVFNSAPKPGKDFAIVTSSKKDDNKLTLSITGGSEYVNKYVHARVTAKHKPEYGTFDQDGKIVFNSSYADSIELILQFCPEKSSVFTALPAEHNYFEFRFEPWIMEFFFKDFVLNINDDGLTGIHPILQGNNFTYEKTGK
jgi:hypothetical protein